MSSGFATWLAAIVIGALLWSTLGWGRHKRRVRQNRDDRCARCGKPLDERADRIGGLRYCATCATGPLRAARNATRMIIALVIAGSIAADWVAGELWATNPRGAWLVLGFWALYAVALIAVAVRAVRRSRLPTARAEPPDENPDTR